MKPSVMSKKQQVLVEKLSSADRNDVGQALDSGDPVVLGKALEMFGVNHDYFMYMMDKLPQELIDLAIEKYSSSNRPTFESFCILRNNNISQEQVDKVLKKLTKISRNKIFSASTPRIAPKYTMDLYKRLKAIDYEGWRNISALPNLELYYMFMLDLEVTHKNKVFVENRIGSYGAMNHFSKFDYFLSYVLRTALLEKFSIVNTVPQFTKNLPEIR